MGQMLSDVFADELLNKLPRSRSINNWMAEDVLCEMPTASGAKFIATIRRCSRRVNTFGTTGTRIQLSGGLEISIQLPTPTYDVGHQYLRSHLKPGWTAQKVKDAFFTLWTKAREEIKLIQLRQEVYALANQATPAPIGDAADKFCDKVLAEEKASGRNSSYRDMTEEDCAHWKKWLQECINKTPPQA